VGVAGPSAGWLVVLLLVAAPAGASPLFVAVVPDLPGEGPGDEGVAVGCAAACSLAGHVLDDGEDQWALPALTLGPGELAWFVGNATRWADYGGPPPSGTLGLSLGNERDGVELHAGGGSGGEAIDAFSWGDGGTIGRVSPGLLYLRGEDPAAWGTESEPWVTPRVHRIGESRLPQPSFVVDGVTAYAAPDSIHGVLAGLLAGARQRLHLHVYELRSPELVDALVAARASQGLDLQVLVDASPVGMDRGEREQSADALRRIQETGGTVRMARGGRYDHHHLKVLVADDHVAIQSENWVASGVPSDPSWGNRGWGIVLHSAEAADWFAGWMQADRDAWDAKAFDLASFAPGFEGTVRTAPRVGEHGPVVPARFFPGPIAVRPFVAPDHTAAADPVSGLVRGASDSVLVQQLDLSLLASNALGWSGEDPLAAALAEAASRAVRVRIQAAQPFSADDTGNADAVEWLGGNGAEARLFDRPGINALHNKGAVVDGRHAIVGSMNGNHHSRTANREVGVIVDSPDVAAYFAGLFAADWAGEGAPRRLEVIEEDLRAIPTPVPILLVAMWVAMRLRPWRSSPSCPSSPSSPSRPR
jgi:cardiolipin synthase A/B